MHRPFFLLALTVLLFACAPAAVPPAPAAQQVVFPATWTPPPSPTPGPPTAAPTRVIQGTPQAGLQTARRLPAPVRKGIGLWASTGTLTLEQSKPVGEVVQLAFGPHAAALRRAKPALISMISLDASKGAEQVLRTARSSAGAADAVLLEEGLAAKQTEARATTDKLLVDLRSAIGTRLLFASTYAWADGSAYAEHAADAQALLPKVDGACLCDFLRTPAEDIDKFKSEADWKKDVDALDELTRKGDTIVLVATRLGAVPDGAVPQVDQWFNYALASYLLGANGPRVYFSYQGLSADNYMSNPALALQLGNPYGSYSLLHGLYVRQFAQGMVVVNAGATAREMTLSRPYVNAGGQEFTRLHMEPHTGLVLKLVK